MGNEKLYLIGEKHGKLLTATESEIINNALEQEKSGVNPHFAFYDQVFIMVVAWFSAVMMEKWLL